MKVHKLSGAGNNFLIVDTRGARGEKVARSKRRKLARELCDVHFSIGADGLLFLEESRLADLRWDFYNADGSSAEMCGNAARTVGKFENKFSRSNSAISIETRAGVVTVSALKHDQFRVEMPALREIETDIDGNSRFLESFDFVNSGVPHAVIEVKLPKNKSLEDYVHNFVESVGNSRDNIVTHIRAMKRFQKTGTNVSFYSKKSSRAIHSLTFERGVEGYTQACGTGAVAAAVAFAAHESITHGKISVRVPGGQLYVEVGEARPVLIGPAIYIGEIRT